MLGEPLDTDLSREILLRRFRLVFVSPGYVGRPIYHRQFRAPWQRDSLAANHHVSRGRLKRFSTILDRVSAQITEIIRLQLLQIQDVLGQSLRGAIDETIVGLVDISPHLCELQLDVLHI